MPIVNQIDLQSKSEILIITPLIVRSITFSTFSLNYLPYKSILVIYTVSNQIYKRFLIFIMVKFKFKSISRYLDPMLITRSFIFILEDNQLTWMLVKILRINDRIFPQIITCFVFTSVIVYFLYSCYCALFTSYETLNTSFKTNEHTKNNGQF